MLILVGPWLAGSLAMAGSTVDDCAVGDAPIGYPAAGCNSVCTVSGSQLTCEMDTLCPTSGSNAVVVTGYGSSTHDVSAWGECTGGTLAKFCCVFDESTGSIDTVELSGTDDADEALSFTTGDRNLQPWDSDHLTGYIRGNEGGDFIYGSDYAGTDYDDKLYGQHGADDIQGLSGKDFLSGGTHDDDLFGGDDNDTLWGGDGDDRLFGSDGNDKLCDASGYTLCATDQGNEMFGGEGDDKLWFNESEGPDCSAVLISSTSSGDAGTNDCGDHNDYVTGDLPQECDAYITAVPVACEGAN